MPASYSSSDPAERVQAIRDQIAKIMNGEAMTAGGQSLQHAQLKYWRDLLNDEIANADGAEVNSGSMTSLGAQVPVT